eukprot:g20511.t1
MTQMVADSYAQEFNKACHQAGLPHRLAFLPVSVVKIHGYEEPLCLEPFLTGDYGVGTFYTDPQIHTVHGEGFGAGNLGQEGIRRFLRTHRHNLLCEQLGLPSPDEGLSDEELAQKFQAQESEDAALGSQDPMITLVPGMGQLADTTWRPEKYNAGLSAITELFLRR